MNELATDITTRTGTNFLANWTEPGHVAHEDEDFPCHQPEEWSGSSDASGAEPEEVDDVEFVYSEAEKDAAKRLAASHGFKRPRSPPLPPSVPDLAEVFDQHDTTPATRVSVCRAYASYVASTLPKKPKAEKKSKKPIRVRGGGLIFNKE